MAETIAFLTARGVPVMAHVGLTPQAVNTLGGYKVVGRDDEAAKVMADARAVEAAGAFSVVLEKVPEGLAARITRGAGDPDHRHRRRRWTATGRCWWSMTCWACSPTSGPKFVKRYAELGQGGGRGDCRLCRRGARPRVSRRRNMRFPMSLKAKP